MNLAELRFPKFLEITPTTVSKVLLIGSCLSEEYAKEFRQRRPEIEFEHILFNHVTDINNPQHELKAYQFQFVQLSLRHTIGDGVINFKEFLDPITRREIIDAAFQALDVMFHAATKFHREAGITTFVSTFIVPQSPIIASANDIGTERDLTRLVRRLNERVADLVAEQNNMYLADVDAIAASIGKLGILDDWHHIFMHNGAFFGGWTETLNAPFFLAFPQEAVTTFWPCSQASFFDAVWRQLEALYRTVKQIDQVKFVIFDLDNTLWRGQVAQHYQDGEDKPLSDGWPEGVAETIYHLRARGILVGVCSKNDAEVVERFWARAQPTDWVQLDHFVIRRINWRTKAENIAEMIAEVGLTPKSVVFVDDNPVERGSVEAAIPEIRTIGANQFLTKSSLLWAAETLTPMLTAESQARNDMVKGQLERERERTVLSREEFLLKLECKVALESIGAENVKFGRALELLNKTNQFNTTARRWDYAELQSFLDKGRLYVFQVNDRFVAYGLVGVMLVHGGEIVQFAMSCRVLGLDVESAALSAVMREERVRGFAGAFTGKIESNELNRVCQDIFAKCGFEQSAPGLFRYHREEPPPPANHLKIVFGAEVPVEAQEKIVKPR
jgi:FkbH-like protein